jgi:hypothetical protein
MSEQASHPSVPLPWNGRYGHNTDGGILTSLDLPLTGLVMVLTPEEIANIGIRKGAIIYSILPPCN